MLTVNAVNIIFRNRAASFVLAQTYITSVTLPRSVLARGFFFVFRGETYVRD